MMGCLMLVCGAGCFILVSVCLLVLDLLVV